MNKQKNQFYSEMLYSSNCKTVSYRNSHKTKEEETTIYHTSSDSKSTPLDVWLCEPLLLSEGVVDNLKTYKEKKEASACSQSPDIPITFPST